MQLFKINILSNYNDSTYAILFLQTVMSNAIAALQG